MTNWDYYESVQRSQRILEAEGISDALRKVSSCSISRLFCPLEYSVCPSRRAAGRLSISEIVDLVETR